MKKILRCPFCGGAAELEEIETKLGVTMFTVGCSTDEGGKCMGYEPQTWFDRRSDAIAAWNKRSVITIPGEDELEAVIRRALTRRWDKQEDMTPARFAAREVIVFLSGGA